MHKFKEMVDHYKSTHRLDNEDVMAIIFSRQKQKRES